MINMDLVSNSRFDTSVSPEVDSRSLCQISEGTGDWWDLKFLSLFSPVIVILGYRNKIELNSLSQYDFDANANILLAIR